MKFSPQFRRARNRLHGGKVFLFARVIRILCDAFARSIARTISAT